MFSKKQYLWLRGADSNRRPPGYEPDELPLLYPAPFDNTDYSELRGKVKVNLGQDVIIRAEIATKVAEEGAGL